MPVLLPSLDGGEFYITSLSHHIAHSDIFKYIYMSGRLKPKRD